MEFNFDNRMPLANVGKSQSVDDALGKVQALSNQLHVAEQTQPKISAQQYVMTPKLVPWKERPSQKHVDMAQLYCVGNLGKYFNVKRFVEMNGHLPPLLGGQVSLRPTKEEKYKTVMCADWLKTGSCKFGDGCTYAHGNNELRNTPHVPRNLFKFKTKPCRNFVLNGVCAFGDHCDYAHPSLNIIPVQPTPYCQQNAQYHAVSVQQVSRRVPEPRFIAPFTPDLQGQFTSDLQCLDQQSSLTVRAQLGSEKSLERVSEASFEANHSNTGSSANDSPPPVFQLDLTIKRSESATFINETRVENPKLAELLTPNSSNGRSYNQFLQGMDIGERLKKNSLKLSHSA